MFNVALIPARGGSKEIPGKNKKLFNGEPLVVWSIRQALDSKKVSEVFVTTDCAEIKELAEQAGAQVPFLRPAHLSDDLATTEAAMIHFCEWYLANRSVEPHAIILLQPTSPIRSRGRIDSVIDYHNVNQFDSTLTVVENKKFLWTIKDGKPEASYDIFLRPRRQDITSEDLAFSETGSIYVSDFRKFLTAQNRLFGKIGLYQAPIEESFDIDTLLDFQVSEFVGGILG